MCALIILVPLWIVVISMLIGRIVSCLENDRCPSKYTEMSRYARTVSITGVGDPHSCCT